MKLLLSGQESKNCHLAESPHSNRSFALAAIFDGTFCHSNLVTIEGQPRLSMRNKEMAPKDGRKSKQSILESNYISNTAHISSRDLQRRKTIQRYFKAVINAF